MYKLIIALVLTTLCSAPNAATSSNAQDSNSDPASMQSTAEDRNKLIAAVVNDQLDAFSKDDGERAFSHASPSIKAYFKTPETFMMMVQKSYEMVYRPKAFEIEDVLELSDKVFQPVLFTDKTNQLYKVVYEMQQQEDDGWKINGVQVLKPKGLAI